MHETRPEQALLEELSRIADDAGGFNWKLQTGFPDFASVIRDWPGSDVKSWPENRARLLKLLRCAFVDAMLATARHPAAGRDLEEFLRRAESTLRSGVERMVGNDPCWKPPLQINLAMERLDLMHQCLREARSRAYAADAFLIAYRDAIVRHGYAPVVLSFRSPTDTRGDPKFRFRTKAELEGEFPKTGTSSLVDSLMELPTTENGLLMVYRRDVGRESGETRVVSHYLPNESGKRLVELVAQVMPAG